MNVVVLGMGAREHALATRLAQDGHEVCVIPGSDAIAGSFELSLDDQTAVLREVMKRNTELVVVGPEGPLANGMSDTLRASGVSVLGPGRAGSTLETSKTYAKAFMLKHGVATARAATAVGAAAAKVALASFAGAVAVKYDGLAAGKGVIVCADLHEAAQAIDKLAVTFGEGAAFVIEERIYGREISLLCVTDGLGLVTLPAAQDHKRLLSRDLGPNTGGMGAYCPVPFFNAELAGQVHECIVAPTLRGLRDEGVEYRGILYFGVMLTPQGPKLIEYNVRFGDPEAQAILPLLHGDVGALFKRAADGVLESGAAAVRPLSAVAVVLASPGYPDAPETGLLIAGLNSAGQLDVASALVNDGADSACAKPDSSLVFHAGTRRRGAVFFTHGGRVLTTVAVAETLAAARENANRDARSVGFRGAQSRSDIGSQARAQRIALLFSGRGSNMTAILESIQGGILAGFAEPVLAVTDRGDAPGKLVAKRFAVPWVVIPKASRTREEYDLELLAVLREAKVEYVILAGFMRILSPILVAAFANRIFNVHPADTSLHQGLSGYAWAFERGMSETSITVHMVDNGLDTGRVLSKTRVSLAGAGSLAEVEARGLAVEHVAYPEAIFRHLLTHCAENE